MFLLAVWRWEGLPSLAQSQNTVAAIFMEEGQVAAKKSSTIVSRPHIRESWDQLACSEGVSHEAVLQLKLTTRSSIARTGGIDEDTDTWIACDLSPHIAANAS